MQNLISLAGKWASNYIQAVTGSVAHGVEAVGIQVALPIEVGGMLAVLNELERYGEIPDRLLSNSLPFVYDTWLSVLA